MQKLEAIEQQLLARQAGEGDDGDFLKIFLGCLNCGKFSAVSVCNEFGT
jgi:hypothetical protein